VKDSMQRLYVGNLPYTVNAQQLQEVFEAAGKVTSAFVVTDKQTRRSKGFGFVEFEDDADAQKAIEMFNNKPMEGRNLVVNIAKPREE
jgi:RNA recognition motif-containing protein